MFTLIDQFNKHVIVYFRRGAGAGVCWSQFRRGDLGRLPLGGHMRSAIAYWVVGMLTVLTRVSTVYAEDACRVLDLGSLGGANAWAKDINDSGQIVGSSQFDHTPFPEEHAFLWQDGEMQDLGTLPGGSGSEARAINELGTIVGSSAGWGSDDETEFATLVPVIWRDGEIAPLRYDGDEGVAVDINNHGQIIGSHGFGGCLLWESADSEPIQLTNSNAGVCRPYAINDAGAVVGAIGVGESTWMAFVWEDGVMRPATAAVSEDDPNGVPTELFDINEAGLAVGRGFQAGAPVPFVWTGAGVGHKLPSPDTVGSAINDWGVIALIQGWQATTLSLATPDGWTMALGELRGRVTDDELAMNNRFQLAWTGVVSGTGATRAYTCQLSWRKVLERALSRSRTR
jgi:probable HAF family extracellular repeat protein